MPTKVLTPTVTKLYHQTLASIEQSLTCGLISSLIDTRLGVFAANADDAAILEYALPNRFEYIPLKTAGGSHTATISGLAEVDLAKGTVLKRRPIALEDIVAGGTPISRAIELLALRPFYFILEQTCITRILTVSDLNLLPVRTYLHTVLDHLEGLMAASIESAHPGDGWLGTLSSKREKAARDLYEQRKRDEFDTRLVNCTTLSDKATILDEMRTTTPQPGGTSRRQSKREYDQIRQIRNRLAHLSPLLNEETDVLRDNLEHGQPILKRKDVKWLAQTTATINAWVEAMSAMESEPSPWRR